jgi:hypothetical protein
MRSRGGQGCCVGEVEVEVPGTAEEEPCSEEDGGVDTAGAEAKSSSYQIGFGYTDGARMGCHSFGWEGLVGARVPKSLE